MNKNMRIQTPLAKAKGKGSAHHGAHHWIMQRLTAIALVPLFVWFVYILLKMLGSEYYEAVAFFSSPTNTVLLSLLIIAGFYHSVLGLQVVVEDYVHSELTKIVILLIIKLGSLILAVTSLLAILKLHFGV